MICVVKYLAAALVVLNHTYKHTHTNAHILGGKWYTTYTHVPHYITNYHRSLMLESLEYAIFDMTSDDSITIELNSKVLTGRIITGAQMDHILWLQYCSSMSR